MLITKSHAVRPVIQDLTRLNTAAVEKEEQVLCDLESGHPLKLDLTSHVAQSHSN